jgi:hypothetical protein
MPRSVREREVRVSLACSRKNQMQDGDTFTGKENVQDCVENAEGIALESRYCCAG